MSLNMFNIKCKKILIVPVTWALSSFYRGTIHILWEIKDSFFLHMYVYECTPVCIHVYMCVCGCLYKCMWICADQYLTGHLPQVLATYVLSQGLSLGYRAGQFTLGMHWLYFLSARTTAEQQHACIILHGYRRSDLKSNHWHGKSFSHWANS